MNKHGGDYNVDDEEAECGSTSWRIMRGKAPPLTKSKTEPPNPSDYITPHPQAGPITTPMVPRPMKGRVTRSAGGTVSVSGVYCQSPATAGKMKKKVPPPPFGQEGGDREGAEDEGSKLEVVAGGIRDERAIKSGRSKITFASTDRSSDNNDTSNENAKIQMPTLLLPNKKGLSSAANSSSSNPPLIANRPPIADIPERSDSLEDELLDQEATKNVAGICCDEIKEHAATSAASASASDESSRRKSDGDDTNPLGGHDSLELLMEKGMELTNGSK